MTPAARASAAITILDRILAGEPAERALTAWGRGARYAGSGDRAAVRDLVYDALRCRRSFAALGGATDGRGLILGGLRDAGTDPATIFDGSAHGPDGVLPTDQGRTPQGAEALDMPDWLIPLLEQSLGDSLEAVSRALRARAPVFLRANLARISRDAAMDGLAREGIVTRAHPLATSAIEVLEGARRIRNASAYLEGLVELQDAASQAVVEALPLRDGMTVLDYCAGGGGKSLAMAARARLELFAHDALPRRMVDLDARAKRAGARVRQIGDPSRSAPFDLVLTDVPCSGSGSWRRDPEGKWALDAERLEELGRIQAGILREAAALVADGGVLAYATCSLLSLENDVRVDDFIAETARWRKEFSRVLTPLEGGDGFFVAILRRI